jgi:hypothetical protein
MAAEAHGAKRGVREDPIHPPLQQVVPNAPQQ